VTAWTDIHSRGLFNLLCVQVDENHSPKNSVTTLTLNLDYLSTSAVKATIVDVASS
jgi:hypothetical protein